MQISLLLMEEIIKLFVIMFMGYAVVKARLMKSSESKSVSVILVYLVIPCVIIKAFQVDYTPDVQKGLFLAIAAAVAVHILFLLITIPLKKIFQTDVIEQATSIYSNAGILVIPLVQELLGQDYVIYSSAYIAVQLILLWTQGKNMLCEEEKLEWKKIFLNVNIISIIAGIVLFLFRIKLPAGVQDVLGMMNNMIGPLGMLLAGMAIAEGPLKSIFTKKKKLSVGCVAAALVSGTWIISDESNSDCCESGKFQPDSFDSISCLCNTGLCVCDFHGTTL